MFDFIKNKRIKKQKTKEERDKVMKAIDDFMSNASFITAKNTHVPIIYQRNKTNIMYDLGTEDHHANIHIQFADKRDWHSIRDFYFLYQHSLGLWNDLPEERNLEVFTELNHFFQRNFDDFTNEDFCIRLSAAYQYHQEGLVMYKDKR